MAEGLEGRMNRVNVRRAVSVAFALGVFAGAGRGAARAQGGLPLSAQAGVATLYSTLNTIGVGEKDGPAAPVYRTKGYFEAPNWSRDGKTLIFDQGGAMERVPAVAGGADAANAAGGTRAGTAGPQTIDVGGATKCSGSHGLSKDGALMAITCAMPGSPDRRVYVLPAGGGTPRMVTANAPSYFHSWSPDQKTILFTRQNNIYAIPVEGGEERALTTGKGVSDDPDYSADGQWIYFNSDRGGGSMQIWRMHPDGGAAEQVSNDERVNWTPHPSPDGRWIVYVSFEPGTVGHPMNKNVELRLMDLNSHKVRVLTGLLGGSGSMNVSSWAPDSRHLAFVSFELVAADAK
jgi:TolB protein